MTLKSPPILWDNLWKESKTSILNSTESTDIVERWIKINNKMLILDVGCGTGYNTLYLSTKYNVKSELIDFSTVASRKVKETFNNLGINHVNITLGNALEMPYKDNTFDLVWNEGVNEHFCGDARQNIFNEIYRVTKKNGTYISIVPNKWNIPYIIGKYLLEISNKWIWGFEKPFTPLELINRMEKAGFKFLKRDGLPFLQSLSFIIPKTTDRDFVIFINKIKLKSFLTHTFIDNYFGRQIAVIGRKI